MDTKELIKRYILFIIGLFVNSLGICLIIKADLGSSPISSLPYTLSLRFPISLGTLTFCLNLFLIAGQMAILKKDFKPREWLQLPVSVLFGVFIDCSMWMLAWISPEQYVMKLVFLVIGCSVLGLGVSLEVIANVVMLSGEAFVQAISIKKKKEFGLVKILFDTSLMLLAVWASLILFRSVIGVREGTIVAAFLVGMFARYFNKHLGFLNHYLQSGPENTVAGIPELDQAGHRHFVITIAREYGSGGREIGQRLSQSLGIPFYDKELIDLAAKENGMKTDYVAAHEQNIPSNLLYEMIMQDFTAPVERSLSFDDALFVTQSKIIRKLATEQSCIIVGRCADFVLKDHPKVVKVFCYSDLKSAVNRCVNDYGIPQEQAEAEIRRINRNRIHHYEYYTGQKWGEPHHYHLMLNTGNISLETACKLVKEVYQNIAKA